jgi:lipopolysaccharide transport system ATP-binding protein
MDPVAISINGVSKFYKLYKASKDRLKEALHPFGKKYHNDYYAIRNLSLDVKRGEILGIVGRNGCGKSTLLKLVSGVLQPNDGEIRVNGKITALLELGAGFNPEFTGRDNIHFYSTILGLSAHEIKELSPAIIEFAELGEFIDQPVKTYSSGMKARLGFAVAVHIEPDILILDEVLAVGDAVFRRKCFAKMEEFFKAGKTVLFVSHDANSINKLCTRAILLHNGNIILDSTPRNVTRHYEKLAFAKEKEHQEILQEIANLQQHKNECIESPDLTAPQELIADATPSNQQLKPYYIPGLTPRSTLTYPTERAEILNAHFTTLTGERVNVLVSGEDYIYSYQVIFKKAAHQVSFGMQIKDMNGMRISAASLGHDCSKLIEYIPQDETIKVSWTFNCRLLSGYFFTNAGVSENMHGEPEFLARIVDAAAIKVIADEKRIVRGIVDLQQTIEIEAQ